MGCGKSKHDVVASGNTVLKRKKSSVKRSNDQEIGAQTKDDNNNSNVNANNVDVNSGVVEVKKDGDNNVVKDVVVGGKVDDVVDSNGVKRSKTENARMVEETVLQKKNDIVVAGENANVGEETVLEKSEEVVVSGGDNKVERTNGENANEGEEKMVEKREEEVVGVVVVADEVEGKTEKTDVKEEEVKEKEGLVPMEVSEISQGEEEDNALKLNENDQKDASVAEENKNGDARGMSIWRSAKL